MNRADHLLARRARRRHGVFTRADALACGLSERALDHRIQSREYEVLWPGIYGLPGSPSTWERSAVAAVLHTGPVAALSHGAAARNYSIPGFESAPLEVTTTQHIRAAEFRVHARSLLVPADIQIRDGIPTTNTERLLLDLSSVVDAGRLEALIDHVCEKKLTTHGRLSTYLDSDRLPKRRRSLLLQVLQQRGQVTPAASDLETLVARLIRNSSLL